MIEPTRPLITMAEYTAFVVRAIDAAITPDQRAALHRGETVRGVVAAGWRFDLRRDGDSIGTAIAPMVIPVGSSDVD